MSSGSAISPTRCLYKRSAVANLGWSKITFIKSSRHDGGVKNLRNIMVDL